MWILPSNHPLYSVFAQECVASKEELNEFSDQLEQSLMWRSKPLLLKIWSNKWSKVYWIRHLFGRILKPSSLLQDDFVEKWTSSLEDTPANRLALRVNGGGPMTPDISGLTSKKSSGQLDLFAASLKTYQDTSILDTERCEMIWNDLVTGLNKEYSQRQKLAHLTEEKDFSSLLWTTPNARDWKDSRGMGLVRKDGRNKEDQLPREVYFLQNTGKIKWSGNIKEQLNPAWVLQLMGTTIEKTFFAWREMESLNSKPNLPSEP